MEELRQDFHEQLDELYVSLLNMGSTLLVMIERTRICFLNLDAEAADRIIADDDVIDDYCRSIDNAGVELIARQAPVAIDLRLIIAILRITQHFERMADLCCNICVAVKHMQGVLLPQWIRDSIDEMARRTNRIVELSIECFKERDVEKAQHLETLDDAVDKLHRGFFREFDTCRDQDLDTMIRVVMISRFFERIADHGVDIGDNVRYMLSGEF